MAAQRASLLPVRGFKCKLNASFIGVLGLDQGRYGLAQMVTVECGCRLRRCTRRSGHWTSSWSTVRTRSTKSSADSRLHRQSALIRPCFETAVMNEVKLGNTNPQLISNILLQGAHCYPWCQISLSLHSAPLYSSVCSSETLCW